MRWLAKLFYYGRVKRLERVQHAAALLAAGRIEEAASLLDEARPTRWVDDLALYHFVRGKLHMEQGALDEAERHLHTALGLGLDRPSVKLNLAVLKVRRCELGAALALLDEVDLADDEGILEQARVMRRIIADVSSGAALGEIAERSQRFRKKHLSKVEAGADPDAQLAALARALKELKLSTKDREDAVLLYGTLVAAARGGHWLLGLEPRDHLVLVGGVAFGPAAAVDQLLAGDRDTLALPPAQKALPSSP